MECALNLKQMKDEMCFAKAKEADVKEKVGMSHIIKLQKQKNYIVVDQKKQQHDFLEKQEKRTTVKLPKTDIVTFCGNKLKWTYFGTVLNVQYIKAIKAVQACNIPRHRIFSNQENHFETSLYVFVKIYPSEIPNHAFTISTLMPSSNKIGKRMPKIESEKQFLTSIKGRNCALICQNLPICDPRTLLSNINSHSKFEENWLKNAPSRE